MTKTWHVILAHVIFPNQPHADLTQTTYRPHADLTQTSYKPHTDLTQTSHRPRIGCNEVWYDKVINICWSRFTGETTDKYVRFFTSSVTWSPWCFHIILLIGRVLITTIAFLWYWRWCYCCILLYTCIGLWFLCCRSPVWQRTLQWKSTYESDYRCS